MLSDLFREHRIDSRGWPAIRRSRVSPGSLGSRKAQPWQNIWLPSLGQKRIVSIAPFTSRLGESKIVTSFSSLPPNTQPVWYVRWLNTDIGNVCRACRHGDRCSRLHNKPTISQTLLLQNMYQNPALNAPPGPDGLPMPIDARQSQEHFEVCATLCKALFLP